DYIVELYQKELITEETARGYATNKGVVGRGIDSVKSSKGEKTTELGKLSLDQDYGKPKSKW
ncbi:MAG: twitching motility protein, partial [Syntrophus sp. (in: bacteria)]